MVNKNAKPNDILFMRNTLYKENQQKIESKRREKYTMWTPIPKISVIILIPNSKTWDTSRDKRQLIMIKKITKQEDSTFQICMHPNTQLQNI